MPYQKGATIPLPSVDSCPYQRLSRFRAECLQSGGQSGASRPTAVRQGLRPDLPKADVGKCSAVRSSAHERVTTQVALIGRAVLLPVVDELEPCDKSLKTSIAS